MAQFARPSFARELGDLWLGYISFSRLRARAEAAAELGNDHLVMRRIAICAPCCAPSFGTAS